MSMRRKKGCARYVVMPLFSSRRDCRGAFICLCSTHNHGYVERKARYLPTFTVMLYTHQHHSFSAQFPFPCCNVWPFQTQTSSRVKSSCSKTQRQRLCILVQILHYAMAKWHCCFPPRLVFWREFIPAVCPIKCNVFRLERGYVLVPLFGIGCLHTYLLRLTYWRETLWISDLNKLLCKHPLFPIGRRHRR